MRSSAAFLLGPVSIKDKLAVGEKFLKRNRKFLAVLKMNWYRELTAYERSGLC